MKQLLGVIFIVGMLASQPVANSITPIPKVRYHIECSRSDDGGLNFNRQNDPSSHRHGDLIHQYQVCREA